MKRTVAFVLTCVWVCSLMSGCSSTVQKGNEMLLSAAEVNQGVLSDLNQYVWQLLGQSSAGNAEAEKVLARLLDGKGIPESAFNLRKMNE